MDLAHLFGKQHAVHVDRGNTAINLALMSAKVRGYTYVLIPDVGGWIHYEPACKKLGLSYDFFETEDGFFTQTHIQKKKKDGQKTAVLFHSLAGYHTKIDVKKLREFADSNDLFLIEDACGMAGLATFGNIVVCSFGRWKPIDAGFGGCIAADFIDDFWLAAKVLPAQNLELKIRELPTRRQALYKYREKIRLALQKEGYAPHSIHDDSDALVLITQGDQAKLAEFCVKHQLEFTETPRMIRSNKKGISIEIKRFTLKQLSDRLTDQAYLL